MTWIPVKTPKPPVRAKRTRAPLRPKKRMKSRNAKRKGSSFPKQRDAKYRRWIWTENPCMLRGRRIKARLSTHDMLEQWRDDPLEWFHCCWGPTDPAHVGDTQARGAPDFGVLVPLCRAAHRFYDNRRWEWRKVTGYTEKQMASAASGYGLKYCEQGGSSTPQGAAQ